MVPKWAEYAVIWFLATIGISIIGGAVFISRPLVGGVVVGILSVFALFKAIDELVTDRLDETEKEPTARRDEQRTSEPTD